ncbi:MAG: hypothetical protein KC964_06215 [Candidatus Omnitrophica bacterium]|nr:hypothetical protein [Candidatus Omnitrophota bacterium]
MKTSIVCTLILTMCSTWATIAWSAELTGGPYSIQPLSINGGGLTSTSGVYEISASIAQPGGVGVIEEGPYRLEDGFWASVLAVSRMVIPHMNYDIRPNPIDGFIDARDLVGWCERIRAGTAEALLLFDFGQFWEGPFLPAKTETETNP